jgi:hypothetical protein
LIVYVVVAVRPEVAPVAVIDFAPAVESEAINEPIVITHDPAPVVLVPPGVVPVVHVGVPKDAAVNALVATETLSPEPKPVIVKVPVPTFCSGNPKAEPLALNEIFCVIVNGVLTVFVPSLTTMVCAPPGRAGTGRVTLNIPVAVVVRQASAPLPV